MAKRLKLDLELEATVEDGNQATPKSSKTIFDLVKEENILWHISKHLKILDILQFRLCSPACHELGSKMLGKMRVIVLNYIDTFWLVQLNADWVFEELARYCRDLRLLDLSGLNLITNKMVCDLVRNNPNLEAVDFYACKKITYRSFHLIGSKCKKLTSLSLISMPCNDKFLEEFSNYNTNLKEFALFDNKLKITKKALVKFFAKQPKLESINIKEFYMNMPPILAKIAKVCKNLKYLNLYGCYIVDNESILKIVQNCPKIEAIILNLFKMRKDDAGEDSDSSFASDESMYLYKRCYAAINRETYELLKSKNIKMEE